MVETPPNFGLQQTRASLRSALAAEAVIRWAGDTCMRTVLIHLADATQTVVEAALTQSYPGQADPWIAYESDDPVLYIRVGSSQNELEPDELHRLRTTLGERVTTVSADVSGRHAGDLAVRSLVSDLLTRFRGLAQDDYTSHFWTLREIQASTTVEGHPFFDYAGWHSSNTEER